MPGAIWKLQNLAEEGSTHQGDQTGFDDALAAVIAAGGGMVQVGPGLEGLAIPGLPGNVVLVQVTNTGQYRASGLRIRDALDFSKSAFFNPTLISPGVERAYLLPDYDGFTPIAADAGVAGRFLRSNGPGVVSTFEAIPAPTNNLLDGVNHLDTVARACVRGHLIVGAAGNLWDRLAVGAANNLIGSDGTDVVYFSPAAVAALVAAVIEHNNQLHLKPFQVAGNVSIGAGSDILEDATLGNRFANVRVGDRINLDDAHYGPSLFGMRALTSGVADANNIQVDRTNTGGAQTLATATVHPADHFDNALLEGLLSTGGFGTYDETVGGTEPVVRGSIAFEGYSSGHEPRWTFWGPTGIGKHAGFNIKRRGAAVRAYIYIEAMAASRWLSIPNLAANDTFCFLGQAQTLLAKTLDGASKIVVDGTAAKAVIQSGGGADRILPDVSLVTAPRNVKWPDYAGIYHVEGAAVTFANGDLTPSVALSRAFQTNNAGATTITAFDDGADGVEIIIRAGDAVTTFQHAGGGTLRCEGAADKTLGVDDIIRFVRIGGVWYQSAPVVVI
jgi:hypothetical protein